MLVVNLYHLQKSHGLVVHIYGMKMWPGDARTLLYPVKLGAGQFLRPDILPNIRIKTKIKSVISHTIPISLVKFQSLYSGGRKYLRIPCDSIIKKSQVS